MNIPMPLCLLSWPWLVAIAGFPLATVQVAVVRAGGVSAAAFSAESSKAVHTAGALPLALRRIICALAGLTPPWDRTGDPGERWCSIVCQCRSCGLQKLLA